SRSHVEIKFDLSMVPIKNHVDSGIDTPISDLAKLANISSPLCGIVACVVVCDSRQGVNPFGVSFCVCLYHAEVHARGFRLTVVSLKHQQHVRSGEVNGVACGVREEANIGTCLAQILLES